MIPRVIRYIFIIGLILYWPTIFLFSHIAMVPGWLLRTEMSDKTMHFMGYLLLTYLFWFAVSPNRKPSFLYSFTWITILLLAIYGGIDEYLQRFTHRSPDVKDFFADMCGVFTSLCVLAVFGFYFATVAIISIILFTITTFAKCDPLSIVPLLDTAFYFAVYACIVYFWSRAIAPRLCPVSFAQKFCLAPLYPLILLLASYIGAILNNRDLDSERIFAAIAGIFAMSLFMAFMPARAAACSGTSGT